VDSNVFINYRKKESGGWARLLYLTLAKELGDENVFLDEVSLEPGVKWLQELRSRSGGCAAFIALIGPDWASIMTKRSEGEDEDFVRSEIEAALLPDSGVQEVIPVLVGDAEIPREDDIRYLSAVHPLLKRQLAELRPGPWDADVEALVERLKEVKPEEPKPPPPPPPPPPPGPKDSGHYDEIVRLLLREDSAVVPFLGPGANSCDRTEPWHGDPAYLPDADELAAYLALELDSAAAPADLADVSQRVSVAIGEGDLYTALQKALPSGPRPGLVHGFLAGLPGRMAKLGHPDRYQLIVTTNYDDALERAFDDAGVPYDLAVYIAKGDDKGRFVHVPCDGEPRVVNDPNTYGGFQIDPFGMVKRTVIMKIHGAVNRAREPYSWRNNYVITEDDYIDYMSVGEIGSIVPQQLLGKLRDNGHFLFLGHAVRDWNLRVFLIRIFGGHPRPNTSWAIQREPNPLDNRFWWRIGVNLSTIPLDDYVKELGERLTQVAGADRSQA
jgi:hypothetical protein